MTDEVLLRPNFYPRTAMVRESAPGDWRHVATGAAISGITELDQIPVTDEGLKAKGCSISQKRIAR